MIIQLYLRNAAGTVVIWEGNIIRSIGRTKYSLLAGKEYALTNHKDSYSTILCSDKGLNKWLKIKG